MGDDLKKYRKLRAARHPLLLKKRRKLMRLERCEGRVKQARHSLRLRTRLKLMRLQRCKSLCGRQQSNLATTGWHLLGATLSQLLKKTDAASLQAWSGRWHRRASGREVENNMTRSLSLRSSTCLAVLGLSIREFVMCTRLVEGCRCSQPRLLLFNFL